MRWRPVLRPGRFFFFGQSGCTGGPFCTPVEGYRPFWWARVLLPLQSSVGVRTKMGQNAPTPTDACRGRSTGDSADWFWDKIRITFLCGDRPTGPEKRKFGPVGARRWSAECTGGPFCTPVASFFSANRGAVEGQNAPRFWWSGGWTARKGECPGRSEVGGDKG